MPLPRTYLPVAMALSQPFPTRRRIPRTRPLPARVAKDDAAFPIYRGALGSIANTCVPAKEVNAFRSITNFSPSPTTV
ncbi:hypothetical protein EMIT0373P_30732 [Pseudomonas chlororaphis]